MHRNIKKAQWTVNPQLATGAFWMVAGLCRSCKAPRCGRGARHSSTRWPCRQSAWGQQNLGDSPVSQSWFLSCGFHSTQLNTQFLGRLISSGTVPREFRLSAWSHRCARANKILLEQSAEEHSAETIQWVCEEPARVSQGQIWTMAYEPCLIPAESTEPFRSPRYVYNLGFFITQSIPVPYYVR